MPGAEGLSSMSTASSSEVDYGSLPFHMQFSLLEKIVDQCVLQAQNMIMDLKVDDLPRSCTLTDTESRTESSEESVMKGEREFEARKGRGQNTISCISDIITDSDISDNNTYAMTTQGRTAESSSQVSSISNNVYASKDRKKVLLISEVEHKQPVTDETISALEVELSQLHSIASRRDTSPFKQRAYKDLAPARIVKNKRGSLERLDKSRQELPWIKKRHPADI